MYRTARPIELLREHAHATDLLLMHETGRVEEFLALVDDCLTRIIGSEAQPTAMDWFGARTMAALLFRVEREVLNGASLLREHDEAGKNPDRRRRELVEATERRAIVRQIRETAEDVRHLVAGFSKSQEPTLRLVKGGVG